MTTTIFRDDSANAIIVRDSNGAQFLNNLQAVTDEPTDPVFAVRDKARENLLLANLAPSDIVDDIGQVYGTDVLSTVNALNALFAGSSTPTTLPPTITSALTVNMTEGDTLNYEATATPTAMRWEFDPLPTGVGRKIGNSRVLIGGSNLAVGSYSIPVSATNMNGETTATLTLNVTAPPYSNTKSINFANQDWVGANAALLDAELGRSGNGAGSGDAWSLSLWFKPSSATQGQTIFYFGSADVANQGYIQVMQINNSGNNLLRLKYGTNNNNLRLQTPSGSLTSGTWHHILITYNGGTTGSSSADLSDYYSRFKIYIDGSLQSTSNSHSNFGYTGSVVGQNLRVGRFSSGNYMRGCRVDELAIWGSDQTSNASDIYNSGNTQDLSSLTVPPNHWWRMGDGDTYPNIQDNVGTADFVMYNMTSADIVTDAPPS